MRSSETNRRVRLTLFVAAIGLTGPARAQTNEGSGEDLLFGDYEAPKPADPTTIANALIKSAQDDYKNKNYVRAAARLERAYALLPEPRVLFNLARSHHKANNRDRAERYYRKYLASGATEPDLEARARQAVAELARSEPPGNEPEKARPRPDAPAGKPQESPGRAPNRTPEKREPSHVLSTVLIGAGAAATIVGIGLGAWALGRANNARDSTDPSEKPELRDSAKRRALYADIALGLGVVAIGSGVVVRVWVERERSEPSQSARSPRPVGFVVSGRLP